MILKNLYAANYIKQHRLVCRRFNHGHAVRVSEYTHQDSLQQRLHEMPFEKFASSIQSCTKSKSLLDGMRLHACVVSYALDRSKLLSNFLVQMYGRCHSIENAAAVFDRLEYKNLFSWNSIISAYALQGQHEEALHRFKQMLKDGCKPNKFVFSSIISACSSVEALLEGRNIHDQIKKSGFEKDVVVGTALLNMYGKCGSVEDAKELFFKLPNRDLVSWNAMIAVFVQHEQQALALQLYSQMQQEGILPDEYTLGSVVDACVTLPDLTSGKLIHAAMVATGLQTDVVIGSALVNMYGKCGIYETALKTFHNMPEQNRVTFISILSACAAQVAIEEGRKMHTNIIFRGFAIDINLGNAIINMYGKCSSLIDAHKMFDSMPERDIISWNAVIAVYAQNGQTKVALQLFARMCKEGIQPNNITFINILSACSHAGLVQEGYGFFLSMESDHGVRASVDHCNCLVDLLVRTGQLDEAECLLESMQIEPTVVSWTTLLGTCRAEVDLERGERVMEHVLTLEPSNPAHYKTIANIFAAAGRLEDASRILNMIRDMEQDGPQSVLDCVLDWEQHM